MSQSDFVSRGQALVASGQFQEAVKVCRLGLLGRPTTVEGRVVLGQALLALKRYDEVLAEMRVALELDHTSFAAQILKGEALLRKGDHNAAVEALTKARQLAPTDKRVLELLHSAEKAAGKPPISASHPSVSFVGGSAGESGTKTYPNHQDDQVRDEDSEEETGDNYTRPTSLAAPKARTRSAERKAAAGPDGTPSPAELAVGDRSGTVEVDPELDGVEVGGDDFDDDVAAPPVGKPAAIGGHRGGVKSSSRAPREGPTIHGKKSSKKTPTAEIEDDDLLDAAETRPPRSSSKKPGASAVRNAVAMPSGPLESDLPPLPKPRASGLPSPIAPPGGRPKPPSIAPPPITAPPIAAPPASLPLGAPPTTPMPPLGFPSPAVSAAGVPGGPIAAALPTIAAGVPPQPPPGQNFSLQQIQNAARQTMAAVPAQPPLSAAQQQSAAAVDALFGEVPAPNWAKATVVNAGGQGGDIRSLAPNDPSMRPVDPMIPNMFAGSPPSESGVAIPVDPSLPAPGPQKVGEMRTGMRRTRSRMQLVLWIVIGVVVIGGGVFAGFQIRRVRLDNQIDAERDRAASSSKADTWAGWTAARDSYAGIVRAASTIDNRAALARARALIAFEFGDGLAEAKSSVDAIGSSSGLDGFIASAYLALAQSDPKAAKSAADAALQVNDKDGAALYVAGQASLLAGDAKTAIGKLDAAYKADARPLYAIGLARAQAAAFDFDGAFATLDKALRGEQLTHPAGVIARGMLLAASGRIAPGGNAGVSERAQIDKLIAENAKSDPPKLSPAQLAFANLALAQIDFARGDVNNARADVRAAAAVLVDDQRFAEEAVDTLLRIGDLDRARAFADKALGAWPNSRRARIALAQISIAQGRPADAVDIISKQTDMLALPRALAVRGQAYLAAGDLEGARGDFEQALKKLPSYEPALVGRAWLALAERDVAEAKKLVEPRFKPGASSAALTTVWAAILRASGDPAQAAEARKLLDAVVQGPPGDAEVARAQLELARLQRDVGDFRNARLAYAAASRTGSFDARLESGLLLIDDRDPQGGRDTLDLLLREAGDKPSIALLLETARARMLVGNHSGAEALLEAAAKNPGSLSWKLDRERGRLALRRDDIAGAIAAFTRALDGSGSDAETFLLAADAATASEAGTPLVEKINRLLPERLKDVPEAMIVKGKLLLTPDKVAEAEKAYLAAKKGLETASPRRQAQAHFGLAVAAYYRKDFPTAKDELALVVEQDPSLYFAYMFIAEIVGEREPRKAIEQLKKAVELDPDSVIGWTELGKVAARLADRKTLADAIGKVQALAPDSDALKELQALRR